MANLKNFKLGRRSVLQSIGMAAGSSVLSKTAFSATSNYETPKGNLDISSLPILDDTQQGHLRHILNLAAQPDGDWSNMMTAEQEQHGLASYRYQLGHLVYALGLTHYHHLPAAPGLFKQPMEQFIQKMQRHDVWRYWREESRSSLGFDPGLTEPREPWSDPVIKENIMYSGHLHAMAGMHAVLFDDDKYEQEKSLTLQRDRMWDGPEIFEYDFNSINDVLYKQMEEYDWLGIPCEPNMIFVICNQLPLLGFRFHDIRNGTNISEYATNSFRQAWADKDVMTEGGQIITFYQVRQEQIIPGDPGVSAHTGALMNPWNRDTVRSVFPKEVHAGLRTAADGTKAPFEKNVLPQVKAALAKGESADQIGDKSYKWSSPDFGFISLFLSETGDTETLNSMLAHADNHMKPSWEKEGLFYPRNDESFDDEGNMVFMDPLTGNVSLAYARLNVPDGMWSLYNNPWEKEHFDEPQLSQVPDTVDVLRASYVADKEAMVLTLRGRGERSAEVDLMISNAPSNWELHRDGEMLASSDGVSKTGMKVSRANNTLSIQCNIQDQTDLVLVAV